MESSETTVKTDNQFSLKLLRSVIDNDNNDEDEFCTDDVCVDEICADGIWDVIVFTVSF